MGPWDFCTWVCPQERNVLLRVGAPKMFFWSRRVDCFSHYDCLKIRRKINSSSSSLDPSIIFSLSSDSGCRAWLSSWRGDLSLVGQILWERVRKPRKPSASKLGVASWIHGIYHWITMGLWQWITYNHVIYCHLESSIFQWDLWDKFGSSLLRLHGLHPGSSS